MNARPNRLAALLFSAIVGVAVLGWGAGAARAESQSGHSPVNARLNLQVNVPQLVMLQIGTPGGVIDTVTFNVNGPWWSQPNVNGDIQPTVIVKSRVSPGRTVRLTVDSTQPLRDEFTGSTIPFSKVSYRGTGNFSGVNQTFNNTAGQIVYQMTGSRTRTGTFRFTYRNDGSAGPGWYAGQVIYTLSCP